MSGHSHHLLLHSFVVVGVAALFGVRAACAQSPVKSDLPDSLVRQATVTETAARKTALARVPRGTVQAVELEREGGHLQYSYDIKVARRPGITEVNVDARSGKVIDVHRESAKDEAREARQEHERR